MSTTPGNLPQRILMTTDAIGPVWSYAVELTRALGHRGIQLGLATMGARLNPAQKTELASLPNVSLFESSYKLEWMDEPRADLERAGNWLLELEQSFRPDVIHLNSFTPGAFPWRTPRIVVGHACVLSWWRAVHGGDAPPAWDDYRESVMAGLHGAELVVAPSYAMLDALNDHYGPFKSSRVIHLGHQLPLSQQRAKQDFIFTAGSFWDAGTNISALADAAPNLPWPIWVAEQESDSDDRPTPRKNLRYLGQLTASEMTSHFEHASIYASPARYEPFGLGILEAAQAGCALVLGDIPSLHEIWGDAALYVSPDEPAALEYRLRDLISRPAEINRLGEAARLTARQYTPGKMAESYLLAYASVATEKRAAVRNDAFPKNESHRPSNPREALHFPAS
ncbi:MAG: glycosyltransferase [Akkermansiaceae bacterium]|nr:glycosyltransferase [Verrucomicrobiales bacterium]